MESLVTISASAKLIPDLVHKRVIRAGLDISSPFKTTDGNIVFFLGSILDAKQKIAKVLGLLLDSVTVEELPNFERF